MGLLTIITFLVGVLSGFAAEVAAVAKGWFTEESASTACHQALPGAGQLAHVATTQPSTSSEVPPPWLQCNSAGTVNHVIRVASGRYEVVLPGLGMDTGIAEVTSTSKRERICRVSDWSRDGTEQRISVVCTDHDGNELDSTFAARYLDGSDGDGDSAYLRYDDTARSDVTPPRQRQFNSQGDQNSVERHGDGEYAVFLPGQQGSDTRRTLGIVHVTPVGPSARICQPEVWAPYKNSRTGKSFLAVTVRCWTLDGQPANASFTLTFEARKGWGRRVPAAAVWADDVTVTERLPGSWYQYDSETTTDMIGFRRLGPGDYAIRLPKLAQRGGHVQVTAYGRTPAVCNATRWEPKSGDYQEIGVVCYQPNGFRADSQFTLSYVGP